MRQLKKEEFEILDKLDTNISEEERKKLLKRLEEINNEVTGDVPWLTGGTEI